MRRKHIAARLLYEGNHYVVANHDTDDSIDGKAIDFEGLYGFLKDSINEDGEYEESFMWYKINGTYPSRMCIVDLLNHVCLDKFCNGKYKVFKITNRYIVMYSDGNVDNYNVKFTYSFFDTREELLNFLIPGF